MIERYRDRLPFGPNDPVVSLEEGSTPLVPAPRISEQAGCEVLSLPLSPAHSDADIADAIDALRRVHAGFAR